MKRKNDPFAGIKITPRSGKQTITYNYQPGVKIRFTLNPTCAAGYLSRGTIGLLDPQTGHLLQTHTDSKSHRFSDVATLELYIPCPRQGETQEQVIITRTPLFCKWICASVFISHIYFDTV